MTEETGHSPTPFTYSFNDALQGSISIEDADGKNVLGGCGCCGSPWCEEVNAEFIIRACNSFDALVNVCRKVLKLYEVEKCREDLEAALDKAKPPPTESEKAAERGKKLIEDQNP